MANAAVSSTSGGVMGVFWGQSTKSSDAAIQAAIQAAHNELPNANLEWFEMIEVRGGIINNNTAEYQVAVRVGYSQS